MLSPTSSQYDLWTREDLITRLLELDQRRQGSNHPPAKVSKPSDFSTYGRRKIALRFCYSGWEYNGLAFQDGPTALPTVEETLYNAMVETRLIDPKGGPYGCGWEKCGRTDKGVSAAGQVVSMWVRSAVEGVVDNSIEEDKTIVSSNSDPQTTSSEALEFDDGLGMSFDLVDEPTPPPPKRVAKEELKYVSLLNRVLPPTIRILAWSPVSSSFSARFACQHRHYKYFFLPAGLDINRMREAAQLLVGEHDFRNLCKLDAGKQITNFRRVVHRADINLVEGSTNGVHVLDLVGSAFLYHQVRHIMSILFLVGTGLEQPAVISALVNVDPHHPIPHDPPLEVVDRKPDYQMADGLPLVLWDCAYADTDVQWRTDSENLSETVPRAGSGSELIRQMNSVHERSIIHSTLDNHFIQAASKFHPAPTPVFPLSSSSLIKDSEILCVPLGAGTVRRTAKYVPLLQRKRLDHVDVANERWKLGKGSRKEERQKEEEEFE